MKLLVVIVNYKTPQLTIDCLQSLDHELNTVPGARVVVTDNASGDGSAERIQKAIDAHGWQSWASVMPLPKNGGFAYGNNAAIAPALKDPHPPKYIYLLNPDTIVLPDALRELVRFMDSRPDVGIGGGRAVNPDWTVRNSAFRFHTVLSELEGALRLGVVTKMLRRHVVATAPPDQPVQVDWVSGASMMVRRDVFEKIGLLDEGYFMYYEETDFCLRAARAGWPCWYVPESKIIHLVGQASGVTGAKRAEKRRPAYWFESRRRYFRQHYGAAKTFLADVLWAGGFAFSNVLNKVRGRPRTDPPWLWWDFVRYNFVPWSHRP
jgi:GT2 family glycosyltransferase